MIRQDIYIEGIDWMVTCYYAVTGCDVDGIMQRLSEAGADRDSLSLAYDNLSSGDFNKGLCYSGHGQSVLVVGVSSSASQFFNSLVHELHHLASHIASALGYDLEGEDVCYIAGEVAGKMFPVASKFLCEHCRHRLLRKAWNN